MAPLETIRARIAKLLNLTEERGASQAEAATAFALAQRMMREHQLSESEVRPSLEDGVAEDEGMDWHPEHDVPQGGKGSTPRTWVGILGYRIGANQGCTTLWKRDAFGRPLLAFFGRKSDCDAAAYLTRLAMAEVERLAKEWKRAGGNGRQANAYRYGVASAMAKTLKQEWVNARAQAEGNPRALALFDRFAQAQALSGIGRGKASVSGSSAYYQGRADGANVSLGGKRATLTGGALRLGSGR